MGFAVAVFQLLRTQVRLKLYSLWHNEPLYRRTWYHMQDRANELRRIPLLRGSVNRPFGFASHGDDDFSSSVSFFQIPDGLGDLGERVRPVDDRCYLSGFDELLEDEHVLVVLLVNECASLLAHEWGQHERAELAIGAS